MSQRIIPTGTILSYEVSTDAEAQTLAYGEKKTIYSVASGTRFYYNGNGSSVLVPVLNPSLLPFVVVAMTKAARNALTGVVAGTVIYQTDNTPGLRAYNGTTWQRYTETAD